VSVLRGVKADRHALRRAAVALAVCLLIPALVGWSNGPDGGNGFGTHDWTLYEANRLAVAGGATWLDWSVAQPVTDDPDMVLHDTYHHVYDIWGSTYGDAPTRVQALYDETVQHLRVGDRASASRSFGLLSHYYSDICNPLHTDQCVAEEAIHSRYEQVAQTYTDQLDENRDWIVPDGLQQITDVTAETEQAAATSHKSYVSLVTEFAAAGMDAQVTSITRMSLNRAANDLADLMFSAARDAQLQEQPAEPAESVVASNAVVATPGLDVAQVPSGQETASADTTSLSASAESSAPVPASGAGPRLLLFWTVMSAAFGAALFGALRRVGVEDDRP